MNFLTNVVVTFRTGMNYIWICLGNAMGKVKDTILYMVFLPQLMTFEGDVWIILIPFGLFLIIKIINFLSYG